MEMIVKKRNSSLILMCFLFISLLQAQDSSSSIIEKIENECNGTENIHYYANETPVDKNLTFSLDEMKISKTQCRLHFFSEVDDEFTLYINGTVYKTTKVNTIPSVKEDSIAKGNAIILEIDYPEGNDKFTLRVESNKYGCFETEVRKEHPMLYVKYWDNTWYLSHTTVFRVPAKHFMNTTTKF